MKMFKISQEEYYKKIKEGIFNNVIYYIDDINRIYIFKDKKVKVVKTDI